MSSNWSPDDDQLLDELGDAVRASGDVPPSIIDIGKAAFAWHNVDVELARLTFDSAIGSDERLVGIRDRAPAGRSLTYRAPRLSIEVEILAGSARGQLIPPQPGWIELRPIHAPTTTVEADEDGWFAIAPIPAEAFQLYVRTSNGVGIVTGWISSSDK
jgi:hypothetical protein